MGNAQELENNRFYKKLAEINELKLFRTTESDEENRKHFEVLRSEFTGVVNGILPESKLTAEHLNFAISFLSDSELRSYLHLIPVSLFADYSEFSPPLYSLTIRHHHETLHELWGNEQNRQLFKNLGLNPVIYALFVCDTKLVLDLAATEGAPSNHVYTSYYNSKGCR